jgi:hypothetical protein
MTTNDLTELAIAEGIAPHDIFGIEDFIRGFLDSQDCDTARVVRRILNTGTGLGSS